jgi:hypothetical protein
MVNFLFKQNMKINELSYNEIFITSNFFLFFLLYFYYLKKI